MLGGRFRNSRLCENELGRSALRSESDPARLSCSMNYGSARARLYLRSDRRGTCRPTMGDQSGSSRCHGEPPALISSPLLGTEVQIWVGAVAEIVRTKVFL